MLLVKAGASVCIEKSNSPFPQRHELAVRCSVAEHLSVSMGPCVVRNCGTRFVFNALRVRTLFHSDFSLSGYQGKYCEVDVDECESNPCVNDGICRDMVNGFTCTCQPGMKCHFPSITSSTVCMQNSLVWSLNIQSQFM